jgi:hypothetical protein
MTKEAFDSLIQQMVPLQGDLCPQNGTIVNPFNDQMMPDLSCPSLKFGGRKRIHRKIKDKSKRKTQSKRKDKSKTKKKRSIRY